MGVKSDEMDDLVEESSSADDVEDENDSGDDDGFDTVRSGKRKAQSQNQSNKKKRFDNQVADDTGINANRNAKEKVKPPTVEELMRLRETETLFNCNLFRLQIDELLTEIKIKQKLKIKLQSWYTELEKFLLNLPTTPGVTLNTLGLVKNGPKVKKLKGVAKIIHQNLPSSKLLTDTDALVNFPKPSRIKANSLYSLDALFGKIIRVDINVSIPGNVFREKDYLNNRYLVKRNVYLANLAAQLQQSESVASIISDFKNGNELQPQLVIRPNFSDAISVYINATPEAETFKLLRLKPKQSNVRVAFFSDDQANGDKNIPTPFYNSVLAHDLATSINDDYLMDSLRDAPNIVDGIKLLCVWLMQRSLNQGFGAFSNELMSFVAVYLKGKGNLNKSMSSYQAARFIWSFLAKTDWSKDGISLMDNVDLISEFQDSHDVVFLDRTGTHNFAFDLNVDVYQKIRAEADKAVDLLDNGGLNSFQLLFMIKTPFPLQYDAIINIFDNDNDFENLYQTLSADETIPYINCHRPLLLKHVTNNLKKGLKNRIKHIVPLTKTMASDAECNRITFGITLDPEYAFNVINMGPNDNEPGVKDFREFWGDLADLRRFKDGTICWAVFFETECIQDKRLIFKRIVEYVLKDKLNLQNYDVIADQSESVLTNKNLILPFPSGTNEEATLKIIAVFDDFSKKLRALSLPLDVTSVQGVSDVFCYSDVFPPVASVVKKYKNNLTEVLHNSAVLKEDTCIRALPKYVCPIKAVIQLSLHSKWPNSLEAIRHIKTAFFLQIANLLEEEHNILSAIKLGFMDVYYQGLVFQLFLYHPKEIAFLKKDATAEGLSFYKDTPESLQLEKDLNVLPKIIGALNGVQSRFPSFGPTGCLIKRWLRSQLIDDYYFSDVAINLLNASLFLGKSAYNNTNLPQVGFFRFLNLLADTDWKTNFVLVNFNDELSKAELSDLETKFEQNRNVYPNLHIVTPYDVDKSVFTRRLIPQEILNKIRILAKETVNILGKYVYKQRFFDTKTIFTPSLKGYNALIHLKAYLNPKRSESIDFGCSDKVIKLEEYTKPADEIIPLLDFNPVQFYLNELRSSYDDVALFLHDSYGGNTIAVLFKPSALQEKEFKVSHMAGRKLKDGKLVLNIEAIVEDFNIIGNDLVKNIEVFN